MPLTQTRTFRVRYYECDAYGHVNNANYLRYMQEAAFDATAAAGYDFARYEEMGCYWVTRETDIEYLRPLRYGDSVEVKTWVHSFERVRSRRLYELRRPGESELAARAYTDWAFVEKATGRPARIPQEMVAAFFPDGERPDPPRRERMPEPPPAPEVVLLRRRVEWHEIDTARMVNNPVYASWAEDAGAQAVAHFGWPIARMVATGFGLVARHTRVEYYEPAVWGDEVEVATWCHGARRSSASRVFLITRARDGAFLARVTTLGVCMEIATGRPMRFPAEFIADLEPNLAHA